MNILCILSHNPGHIDFGGMGFLRLAEQLKNRGNRVVWTLPPDRAQALTSKGFDVVQTEIATALRLAPFFSVEKLHGNPVLYKETLTSLRMMSGYLESSKPDLILVDRLLPLAAMTADQLQIPCAVVGIPEGYWEKRTDGVFAAAGPVSAYQEVGEEFKRLLGWKYGELPSVWAKSGYLNICFMGKTFYGLEENKDNRSAFVHHFKESPLRQGRDKFGISFGNSGDPQKLIQCIHNLMSLDSNLSSIEVYTGTNQVLFAELKRKFGTRINLHAWVSFPDHFQDLCGLACFGGVGTIWECVNNDVPVFAMPDNIADQIMNGYAVQRLGIGECMDTKIIDATLITRRLEKVLTDDVYSGNIAIFKEAGNYTDTMETVIDKLTGT